LFEAATITDAELVETYRKLYGSSDAPNSDLLARLRDQVTESRRREIWQKHMGHLKAKAELRLLLVEPTPRRIQVDLDGRPTIGRPDAPIQIVEYADFECEHCRTVQPVLRAILQEYGDHVRLTSKHLPVRGHPNSHRAAEASECAAEQGRFWPYQELLFEHSVSLSMEKFRDLASTAGLDVKAFDTCLSSGRYQTRVSIDVTEARTLGFQAAPAFVINGRYLPGARTLSEFRKILDAELREIEKEKGNDNPSNNR
jgi:protein-disulfide isomerase